MPNDPPPDFVLNSVDLPGRTFVAVQYATILLSFHPDDADDAARIVAAVQSVMTGRAVSYVVR